MARKRRTYGAYRSPPTPRQMAKAGEAVTTAVAGKDLYAKEYGTRGILRMEVFQELIQPIVTAIKMNPDLTPEQKAIGVKEAIRRFREKFASFQMSILAEATRFAQTFVIAAPVASPRPSASPEAGWLV